MEVMDLGEMPVAVLKLAAEPATGPQLYRVCADHLQTPRVVTRTSDSKIVRRWDNAAPFGLDQPDENPNHLGVFTHNLRLKGQVYDIETNIHYNYHRDYDPQTGQYVQSDFIGLKGGMHTYTYIGSNPTAQADPLELAYFTYRPLNGMPGLESASNNSLDNALNTSASHEQLFIEDYRSASSIGFMGDGTLKTENNPLG